MFKHVSDGTTDSPHGDTAKAGPGHCPHLLNKRVWSKILCSGCVTERLLLAGRRVASFHL